MATPQQQAAALARRQQRFQSRIQWFGDRVSQGIRIGMKARRGIAAQLLRDKVVINISRPVTKIKGVRSRDERGKFTKAGRTKVDPTSRSKPGEFPKADTTRLMKDIFFEHVGQDRTVVGTTLDYGLILETKMNRSFLLRTLREERPMLTRILVHGSGGTVRFPGEE